MIIQIAKSALSFETAEPEILKLTTPLYVECMSEDLARDLLDRLPRDGLGIVGTREPNLSITQWLRDSLRSIAGQPLIVISGLARGVDSVAHEVALESGVPTVGIVAGGLDQHYPLETYRLRQRIIESGGAVISEFPAGTPPYKSGFLARNRWIAAFSRAVVVGQAGVRSGALNTARWTRELGRDLYAVPCFPGARGMEGNQRLLEEGGAYPFWGVRSLGTSWPALGTDPLKPHRNRNSSNEVARCIIQNCSIAAQRVFESWIESQAIQEGSEVIEVHRLCAVCASKGLSTGEFYEGLRECLERGILVDVNGLILKNASLQI